MAERYLQWRDDGGQGHRFDLVDGEISIGRKPGSMLQLPYGYISGQHAKIVNEEDAVTIVDTDSTNGTYVNDQPVTRQRLRSGDRIRLGQLEVTYWDPVDSPAPGPGAAQDPAGPAETFSDLDLNSILATATGIAPQSELEKMSLLLDFQYQWGQQFSPEAMFQQILKSALQISGAERGYILLRGEEDFEYEVGLDANLNLLAEKRFLTSRTVMQGVAREGRPVFMTEGLEGDLASQESIVARNVRAVACLPLTRLAEDGVSQEVMGILYLDSTKTMHALSGLDERILGKLALEAGNVLEKIEMIRGIEEKKVLEKELALARETQAGLLPHALPEVEGLRVRAYSQPTRYVSGDFHDFIEPPGEGLVAVLADVSGKGVAASLLGSSLQGALQTLVRIGLTPDAAVNAVNAYACDRSEAHRFVTLFLLAVDGEGEGSYMNAGHVPPYLYRAAAGEIEKLGTGDLILGMFEDATFQRRPLRLAEGDTLLVYSDGLTDATNAEGEMFGEERVRRLVESLGAEGAESLEAGILQALDGFVAGVEQTDDITFIVIERHAPEEPI